MWWWCACRICPTSRILLLWSPIRCWACGMWRIYGRWGFRILCSCPAPKIRWTICCGCVRAGWRRRCCACMGPGFPFWVCAAVIRCWEKRWTIPKVPRAVVRAACAVWGCCRCGRCSPAKKHAPGLSLWHWRNPLPGRGWKGMRSIWAVQKAGVLLSARWKMGAKTVAAAVWCGEPISTVCLTPGR